MGKRGLFALLTMISAIAVTTAGIPKASSQDRKQGLRMVFIDTNSKAEVRKLARIGIDIAAVRKGPMVDGPRGLPVQSYRVEAVVSDHDVNRLDGNGFRWSEVAGKRAAAREAERSYSVYRSFDEPGTGIKAQLHKLTAAYPKLAELDVFGKSIQGRPMLAMRLTNERIRTHKPGVLFLATHHAREWVAAETTMRLIKYLVSNYGSDTRVTRLLDTTEVWVIPVANPDGYEYTFTTERLWRKNLRDNNGDGVIGIDDDGVDLNRNFDAHWGYDDEGSSPIPGYADYRGPGANSEPETRAVIKLVRNRNFKFVLTYHTYSNLILYPWSWQTNTKSLDDGIFVAQAGTDDNPSIWDSILDMGYDPGLAADLYITNGDLDDWAYGVMGIPTQTIELTYGYDADGNYYGFEFPDDEAMVEQVFQDNLPFALAYAESAARPSHPVSPIGIETLDVYHEPVAASYGNEQAVTVVARKGSSLKLVYSINGGAEQTVKFREKLGSLFNSEPGVYYSRYQALIADQREGDDITYSIGTRRSELGPYGYSVARATGNPILLVAAEDYTGEEPTYPSSEPLYLSYYTEALEAGGFGYDLWDVDAEGAPPSEPEVLSHYRAVIWYTGDDYMAETPYGLDTSEAEVLSFRDFMNYDGGKLFATGQDLSFLATAYYYYSDDFYQYYMGAYATIEGGGTNPSSGLPYDVAGMDGDPVFGGLTFSLEGDDSANNQFNPDTFLTTSYFLPNFGQVGAARYVRPGDPFTPESGDYYAWSNAADGSYKRLGGIFTLPADSPTLKARISADTEADFDFAFVEISEVGSETWTTLPDLNGLTSTNVGQSCLYGWVDWVHPFLAHYMDADCNPTGATGAWNAFSGDSGGWHQLEVDLSEYAGKTVNLYISYASDWGIQGMGVFIDDIELSGQSLEDFEAGTGAWSPSNAPGSYIALNNWESIAGSELPEGSALRTADSVYLGFGFEGIDTADARNQVMDRVMTYLGE